MFGFNGADIDTAVVACDHSRLPAPLSACFNINTNAEHFLLSCGP
jgi:hypothetical protein